MIIVLKKNHDPKQPASLLEWLNQKGLQVHTSVGVSNVILGIVGDTTEIDIELIEALDMVESVKRVQEPYKNANRKFHPEDTIVEVGQLKSAVVL